MRSSTSEGLVNVATSFESAPDGFNVVQFGSIFGQPLDARFAWLFQIGREHICDPFHEGADPARQIAPMRNDEGHGERPATKLG